MFQSRHGVTHTYTKKTTFQYLQFLPLGYDTNHDQKYPLILFLHGIGERGNDLEKIKLHGLPKMVEDFPDFPFILISPQCPDDTRWECELDAIDHLLNTVVDTLRVDEDRIILTGLSMGGAGTWAMVAKFPDRFAAIVPICGAGDPSQAEKFSHVPVWIFHGTEDKAVPFERSSVMYEALKNSGGLPRFTIYNGAGHDVWIPAYDTDELYEWMAEQSRKHSKE